MEQWAGVWVEGHLSFHDRRRRPKVEDDTILEYREQS